jgi:taurine transport system permease protein
MGLNDTVRGILDPLIELYRPVPPLAYLPLMVIWFGIGETSKILLIYLAIFAPVALSARGGSAQCGAGAGSRGAARWVPAKWQVLRYRDIAECLAGNPNRYPHRAGRRLVNAGCS